MLKTYLKLTSHILTETSKGGNAAEANYTHAYLNKPQISHIEAIDKPPPYMRVYTGIYRYSCVYGGIRRYFIGIRGYS